MLILRILFVLLIACLLTACVNIPTGPSVMTLPGSGKSFDQFRSDEYECRQYADEQVGGTTPRQASRTSGIESAAIGAGLGAAAGAALGGGHGAAIGAGTGLFDWIKHCYDFRVRQSAAIRHQLFSVYVCQGASCSR